MHDTSELGRAALVLLIGCTLSACTLGPAYHHPATDFPARYQAEAPAGAKAGPAVDWWRGFGSPVLDGLITAAEAYNFDIAAAIARIREADAQVRIAGAPLLPTLNLDAQDTYSKVGNGNYSNGRATSSSALIGSPYSSGRGHYTDSRSYNLLFSASYELDFWGRLRATQEAAEASALFSRYDQQTVSLDAVTSVATTYFTALAYQDRVAIAERNLHDAEDILQAIRGRLSVGTASQLDVAQQQALADGVRAEIPGLRSSADQEALGLATLVGRNPEAIALPAGTLNTLALPEVAPGLPSELLQRRPDVAAAEAQLIAANADIRAARAAFFPQITLTSEAGWESTALSTLINPGSVLFQVVAGVAQTIFDNGSKGGQYEYDKARYDELLADYRKAVVQAFTDVETALVAYRDATEQERLQQRAVATAQLAVDIVRAQVAAGTSDIVTALQAEQTLFSDLDTLAQIRLTRFSALVDLYKALGGGWTQADTQAPASTIFHGVL